MLAMEPFYNGLRKPKKTAQLEDSDNAAHSQGTIETNIAKSFRKMATVLLLNINVTIEDINVAGRVGSLLEEVIHLADVIQSCAEEPYKVSFSMHFSGE